MIALLIGYESAVRLWNPQPISFSEAIPIACIGLGVNLASAWLLHDHGDEHPDGNAHNHEHHHGHWHDHKHQQDTNIRAAYVHVLADALTSVLAIIALLAGRFYGWVWLDPVMGLVGALVIAAWSWSLIRTAGGVLLDTLPSNTLRDTIRRRLEVQGDRVSDLHLWRLGPGHNGLIVAVVSDHPLLPIEYKKRLEGISGLAHVTVEVHPCTGHVHSAKSA